MNFSVVDYLNLVILAKYAFDKLCWRFTLSLMTSLTLRCMGSSTDKSWDSESSARHAGVLQNRSRSFCEWSSKEALLFQTPNSTAHYSQDSHDWFKCVTPIGMTERGYHAGDITAEKRGISEWTRAATFSWGKAKRQPCCSNAVSDKHSCEW